MDDGDPIMSQHIGDDNDMTSQVGRRSMNLYGRERIVVFVGKAVGTRQLHRIYMQWLTPLMFLFVQVDA